MTLWAWSVGTDLQIHLGDIVAMVTCALLVWIASRIYGLVAGFFKGLHDRVADNGERLDATEQMVDRHSRSLVKWEPLEGPVERLYHRRRHGDTQALDDEEVVT